MRGPSGVDCVPGALPEFSLALSLVFCRMALEKRQKQEETLLLLPQLHFLKPLVPAVLSLELKRSPLVDRKLGPYLQVLGVVIRGL